MKILLIWNIILTIVVITNFAGLRLTDGLLAVQISGNWDDIVEEVNNHQDMIIQNQEIIDNNRGFINNNAGFITENRVFINESRGLINRNQAFINKNRDLINGITGSPNK